MFVSFDAGKHWQSLPLDLPHTPVTDIKVHRKDLVLSTMGRSFWILDDLSPLHQLDEKVAGAKAHLFKPRDAYRMRWSGRRRSDDGATPEYPPYGAILYYYLAEAPADDINLEILDAAGAVVRDYTSKRPKRRQQDEGSFMRPGFGARGQTLSKEKGMHRFAWDLRYPGPRSVDSDRPSGRGPMAVPGMYQVRLTVGDWSQTQNFELKIDPRIAQDGVTQADVPGQLTPNLRTRGKISALRAAVAQIRSVRAQLDSITGKIAGTDGVLDQTKKIAEKLTTIEEALIQTKEGKVGAQLKPKLQGQLTYLAGMTARADQKPGRDAHQRLADIEKILAKHTESIQKILDKDVKKLNGKLRDLGQREVEIGKK